VALRLNEIGHSALTRRHESEENAGSTGGSQFQGVVHMVPPTRCRKAHSRTIECAALQVNRRPPGQYSLGRHLRDEIQSLGQAGESLIVHRALGWEPALPVAGPKF